MSGSDDLSDPLVWEGLFDKLSACRPSRTKGVKALIEFSKTHKRPRTSGVVGPELDYSFRYADIPNDEFGRRGNFPTYKLLRELIQPHSADLRTRNNPGYMVAAHQRLETVFVSKEGIRAWTRFAMKYGVTFDGERRYKFPRKSVWNGSVECLNYLTTVGRSGVHRRTEAAKLRRSQRRRANALSPKGPFTPVFAKGWETLRTPLSASSIRNKWFREAKDEPWSSFRDRTRNDKILAIGPVSPRIRGPIPQIVVDSLNRIYSTSVLEQKPRENPRVIQAIESIRTHQVQKMGNLSFPVAVGKANRIRFIQTRLSQLRDTLDVATSVRWYNANKEYTELSSELKKLTEV